MFRTSLVIVLLGSFALFPVALTASETPVEPWRPPEGFMPPPLHPAGAELTTKELAPGVYALVSSKPPVDNSGFVVGEEGVLVIDSHINGEMARKIQDAVRAVTAKPVLYLVNTNYHGDHTFGNSFFPEETRVVAHRLTAERMKRFEEEKQFLLQTVNNDAGVYSDARLRLPDLVFDDFLSIDLGGVVVELHHFGPGNTPGDTVVYVPSAKAAWTGNFILGEGTIPFLIEGGIARYMTSLTAFASRLDVSWIVPGHGLPTDDAIVGRYLGYLSELSSAVRSAVREKKSREALLDSNPLAPSFLPPEGSPVEALSPFLMGLHRWNLARVYRESSALSETSP